MLPAEEDAQWLNNNGTKCVASLDTLYFMQEQTGVVMCYFYVNYKPRFIDVTGQNERGTFKNIGTYNGTSGYPSSSFSFAYGAIAGYTSNSTNSYSYFIGGDKTDKLRNRVKSSITDQLGKSTLFYIPVTRH